MRASPASKKKVEMDRFYESRVLISSSTINPLSKNISTKLDLIKQEISREYHEKYPTQKKRATSGKKTASNNKTKVFQNKEIDSVRRKLNFNDPPPLYNAYEPLQRTPNQAVYYNQNNNSSENGNFRERYYELQDKLISEKRKMIQEFEKHSLFKQKIIDFLEDPSNESANEIKQYFTTQRHKKIIEKFLSMVQDIEYAEKTLSQLLAIVEVEDTETLIQQLKKRQLTYKNISECSFKLLELETAYNKLQKDSEAVVEQCNLKVVRMQEKLKLQLEDMEIRIKRITQQKEEQKRDQAKRSYNLLQKTFQKINQITYDLSEFNTRRTNKSKSIENSEVHRQSSMQQIQLSKQSLRQYKIDNILRKIEEKFQEIQLSFLGILNQSEINTQKILSSREDIQRLEFLLQKITYENQEQKLKLIEHFEERTKQIEQQFNCQKRNLQDVILNFEQRQQNLNSQIKAKEEQLDLLRQSFAAQSQQSRQKFDKKQSTLRKILKSICDITGKSIEIFQFEEISSSQKTKSFNHYQPYYNLSLDMDEAMIHNVEEILNDHFSVLKGSLQSAENMVLWHQKQIQIKEGLLKQFDFNLKKMMQQLNSYQQKEKEIQFQRDQYKYLLNSLRENVREMKKQHEEALAQVAKYKDQEYLNSNRDILLQNQRLNNQLKAFHRSVNDLTEQLKSESNSHSFFKKKSDQLQLSLSQTKQKLALSETEALRYKNHLSEIEQSFKEVENMSQINSQKLIVLEQQNKDKVNEVVQLRAKVKNLLTQISEKDENYIKVSSQYDDLKTQYNKTYTAKEDLEYENTNIRFKNLEIGKQCSENIEKLKAAQAQNTKLNRQNKKLLEEVNSLTNKLLKYLNEKMLVNKTRKQVRQVFEEQIKQKLDQMKAEYRENKQLIRSYLSECKTLMNEESKQIKRQIQEYCKYQQNKKDQEKEQIIKNMQVSDLKEEKGQILKCKKQLSFVRDNLQNCREYCNYVKLEFQQQLSSILKIFKYQIPKVSKKQSKVAHFQVTLMKMKLCLNSLRNESQQLRQSFEDQLKGVQTLLQIPESVKSSTHKKQQFSLPGERMKFKEEQKIMGDGVNQIEDVNASNEKRLQIEIQESPTPQFGQFKKFDHRRKRFEASNDQNQEIQQDFILEVQEESNLMQQNKNAENLDSSYQQKIFSERVARDVNLRIPKDPHFNQSKKGEVSNNQMSWSGVKPYSDQIQRVMKILVSLKNNQSEEPKVPYFNFIKKQFQAVKNRMSKNILDISGISFRNNTISSPSSANFSKEFLFDKRFNTEPNEEMGGALSLAIKETNRSEYKYQNAISPLLKENEELKQQIERIDEQLKIYQYRQQQYKIAISELQKQKTQLQNEASKQMKEKLILKLITDICKQNWKDAENSCKILLKLMKLTPHQINEKIEAFKAFISKHQKKNSGFMSGLFKNNKT